MDFKKSCHVTKSKKKEALNVIMYERFWRETDGPLDAYYIVGYIIAINNEAKNTILTLYVSVFYHVVLFFFLFVLIFFTRQQLL